MSGPKTAAADALHAIKYRLEGENFSDAMSRIAFALAQNGKQFTKYNELISSMRFLPAGRVQTAIGSGRNVTAMNCVVSSTIRDSLVEGSNSILDTVKEAATVLQMGAGIGYDFSTLRPKGALVKKLGSLSSGPLSFMQVFDALCKTIASAGHRRGAQMGIMRVSHPDIEEFITSKTDVDNLTAFNISVGITDDFMEAVIANKPFNLTFGGEVVKTIDAAYLYDLIMQTTWDYADPGVVFLTTVNKFNPLHGLERLDATNPCFTGETKVWTENGYVDFATLAASGKDVKVLTQTDEGKLVYRTMRNPRVTQRNASIVRVSFDDGTSVRCTPEHKFYLKSGQAVEARNLAANMSIQSVYRVPANQKGYRRLRNGIGTGILEHHVAFEDCDELGSKFHVHHKNGDKTNNRTENLEVMLASEHNSMHMRGDRNPLRRFPEKNPSLYRDMGGKNNSRYRHDIDDNYLQELRDSGLSYAAIANSVGCSKYMVMQRLGWERLNHRVVSVETLSVREDVYCGTVEETGKFFIGLGEDDGVLVSNCAEQPLPPNGCCCLGSFNLTQYIRKGVAGDPNKFYFDYDQLKADVPTAVRFMDRVIDVSNYPLEANKQEMMRKRRIGIGVTGMANAVEALGFAYGSTDYIATQTEILSLIQQEAWIASINLARELGPAPVIEDSDAFTKTPFAKKFMPKEVRELIGKYGIRNSHLTSIAPTGTISMTADNISSSIEPTFSLTVERQVQLPKGIELMTLKDYGAEYFGSSPKVSDVLTVDDHVNVLLAAQSCVDSAVSKTCNVGSDVSYSDFSAIYRRAWEGGAKGCTTFRANGKKQGILKSLSVDEEGGNCYITSDGQKICG